VLLLYPAFDALREDWRESAALLGANGWQFWRHIGLPVLTPALLGTFVILLANALGAYATVYALTTGNFNVLPIRIAGLVPATSASTRTWPAPWPWCWWADDPGHGGPSMAAEEELPCALNPARPALPSRGGVPAVPDPAAAAGRHPALLARQQLVGDHAAQRPDLQVVRAVERAALPAAFGQSLLVCVGALMLSVVLILPLLFVVHYHFPKLDALMNILILLPFAVPPVVSSVGLLQLYGSGPMAMVGTPWILIGCYFTVALPFMYRAITNNLQAINLRDLMDAAQLLGASTWQAAFLVVLPNLRKGLMVALLLSFSFLFGEFVFANILVGTRYETLQVYLNNMRNSSGHFTSALVISYFFFVLVLTWVANILNKDKSQ
jgi:putative spermidine/putrescine transport system permease protein